MMLRPLQKWEIEYEISNRCPGFWENNSKGRADVIIETDNNIFIFEFKLDGSSKEALEQIEKQQYALPYLTDSRPLHKIGVNISSISRTVEEWVVKSSMSNP